MSLWAVLVTGLFAGGASCAAVQGGLLAGAMGRRQPSTPHSRVKSGGRRRPAGPPPRPTAREDAVPVAGFLAGKLASHTLLGALLGLAGGAIQLGPRTRAWVQITAGAVMVLLALDLLGVKAVRVLAPRPPAAWGWLVRRAGRWESAMAPGLLGLSTLLIPCGVTLGMEFLAIASRNPFSGAAIMATFVAGTSPLFAAIGYAARRSATALRGRLALLSAAAVAVAGLLSINSGLVLAGSQFTLASAWSSMAGGFQGGASAEASAPLPAVGADGIQHLELRAGGGGYSPSHQRARAGVPTTLTVHTAGAFGCTRAFVIPDMGVQTYLEATGDKTFDLGTLAPGDLRFTCAMGMYSGTIEAT